MGAGPGPPVTRYASVGDADIAYQVLGSGATDLVFFWGLGSHVELVWDSPPAADYLRRLASFSRLIVFDRRGTGASDRIERDAVPTWEQSAEDVRAVLDAVGSERAAIMAGLDAGPIGIMFAATHPERVDALILGNTAARFLEAPDYPIGASRAQLDAIVGAIESLWGTPELLRSITPATNHDPVTMAATTRMFRSALTPKAAAALFRYVLENVDARAALPLVQARTLVLHNIENPLLGIEHARYLAEHIPDCRLIESPAGGLVALDSSGSTFAIDTIAEFLTGGKAATDVDRVLATILFTDIVGSTEQIEAEGDARWRTRLDEHDRVVRDLLRRHRGQEVNTTGDGFVASFDGPARTIRCAVEIVGAARDLGLTLRAGLHTGECELRGSSLAGFAVHVAARVCGAASGGDVVVTATVRDLVMGSGIVFDDLGEHPLKGVSEPWRLHRVRSA